MRWTVEIHGTSDPVVSETDDVCEAYDTALEIYYTRRGTRAGLNVLVKVTIRWAGASSGVVESGATSPLNAFAWALGIGLDQKRWGVLGDETFDHALGALQRVQAKLVMMESTQLCRMTQ